MYRFSIIIITIIIIIIIMIYCRVSNNKRGSSSTINLEDDYNGLHSWERKLKERFDFGKNNYSL